MEKNPDDKDINASLKQAREKLADKEEKGPKTVEITEDDDQTSASSKPDSKKGAFKRVSIEEDSEDSAEEEKSAKA